MPNQIKLITRTELKTWAGISEHIEDIQLNPFILSAQEKYIKDVLGKTLYESLITRKGNDTLTYDDIALIGELVPYLAFAVKVTWLPGSNVMSTQKGYMRADDDYATHPTGKQLAGMVSTTESMMETHRANLIYFLNENKATYTTWDNPGDCDNTTYSNRIGAIGIRKIGGKRPSRRTDQT